MRAGLSCSERKATNNGIKIAHLRKLCKEHVFGTDSTLALFSHALHGILVTVDGGLIEFVSLRQGWNQSPSFRFGRDMDVYTHIDVTKCSDFRWTRPNGCHKFKMHCQILETETRPVTKMFPDEVEGFLMWCWPLTLGQSLQFFLMFKGFGLPGSSSQLHDCVLCPSLIKEIRSLFTSRPLIRKIHLVLNVWYVFV